MLSSDSIPTARPVTGPSPSPNAGEILFRLEQVSLSIGGRRVLSELSFELSQGEIIGVTGANGAGKSTLLELLAGLRKPTSGRIAWGRGGNESGRSSMSPPGVLLRESFLYEELSVSENLTLWCRSLGIDSGDIESEYQGHPLFKGFTLRRVMDARPGQLSMGMRQRVLLFRASLGAPPFLLLDEPLSYLDREASGVFINWLTAQKAMGQLSALIALHELQPFEGLLDQTLALSGGGRVLAVGGA